LYFEAVSTLALGIGLLVGELLRPGKGFNIDPATLDPNAVASYVHRAQEEGIVAHLGANSIATSIYLGFGPTNVSVNGALKRHHFFPKKNRGREFI
jgi:aerobic C4-dicarboxylate transport protein